MIYLFAPDQRQAEWWCRMEERSTPPLRRRDVRIFTPSSDVRGLMGHCFEEGDRVVIYNSAGIDTRNRTVRDRWGDLMFNLRLMESRSGRRYADREYVR